MEQLFVYGTLQDPVVQQRVIGREIEGKPDVLDDYFKSEIVMSDGTFPIIVPEVGKSVAGKVLDVTQEEIDRMDIYETSAYRRIRVTLRSGQETWVYAE